eukprot:1178913-Prorocentrum_minimum.AAC.1
MGLWGVVCALAVAGTGRPIKNKQTSPTLPVQAGTADTPRPHDQLNRRTSPVRAGGCPAPPAPLLAPEGTHACTTTKLIEPNYFRRIHRWPACWPPGRPSNVTGLQASGRKRNK